MYAAIAPTFVRCGLHRLRCRNSLHERPQKIKLFVFINAQPQVAGRQRLRAQMRLHTAGGAMVQIGASVLAGFHGVLISSSALLLQ